MKKKIIKLRKQLKLSQKEFGDKIAVGAQSISNWEKGKVVPSRKHIAKVIEAFNLSDDYFGKEKEGLRKRTRKPSYKYTTYSQSVTFNKEAGVSSLAGAFGWSNDFGHSEEGVKTSYEYNAEYINPYSQSVNFDIETLEAYKKRIEKKSLFQRIISYLKRDK